MSIHFTAKLAWACDSDFPLEVCEAKLHADNALTMHVIREVGDGATTWAKVLTVSKNESVASFTYIDELVRTEQGWCIKRHKVSPRHESGEEVSPA